MPVTVPEAVLLSGLDAAVAAALDGMTGATTSCCAGPHHMQSASPHHASCLCKGLLQSIACRTAATHMLEGRK